MATPKPWVDGPYKLIESPSHRNGCNSPDPKFYAADNMTNAHNVFIRAINAIIHQARGVSKPQDIADFCTFGLAFVESIQLHHSTEEEAYFPSMEKALGKPGAMEVNVEQHHVFHDAVDRFHDYCQTTNQKPENYSADKMLELTKAMSDDLVVHLHDEIDTLLALGKEDDPEGSIGRKCVEEWEPQILKHATREVEYPFVLGCIDSTYEDGMWTQWPPIPVFVKYLIVYWFGRKHHGAWRFAPCYWTKPRELQFLPRA